MSQRTCKKRFANTCGSHEKDILFAVEKPKSKEVTNAIPVEGDRCIPVKILKRLFFFKLGTTQPKL